MLNLQKRINGVDDNKRYMDTRIAVREKLLAQEVKDLENNLKNQTQCKVSFPTRELHEIDLVVTPQEGMYRNGVFKFHITVPPEYNIAVANFVLRDYANFKPPQVKCLTKVWHPNITEDGQICLSLLRQNSLDQFGWRPTRNITEVVHGLASLFTDLIDFEDALNNQAAQQWSTNKEAFAARVREYINRNNR